MAKFRVGCVPYVNAAPLIWPFVEDENRPIEVIFDVPSQLPARHQTGEIDAMLVSSIDALRTPGAHIVDKVCIGSNGPVESVRLFSRVPFGMIQTLALDQSSMTSNALAQIILREGYGSRPNCMAFPPDLEVMLDVCDAAIIIGDNGLTAQSPGARVLDLGQAWTDNYNLPFVWALWTSHRPIDPELANLLQSVLNHPVEESYPFAIKSSGWEPELVARYLTNCVQFQFGNEEQIGLQLYASKLQQNAIVSEVFYPTITEGTPAPN
ncbi:hypothetical protein CCB80_12660 [Armatimonadetes bacterium Uphvl-Ar1]|nr:hypothetical protein CCB80_12660 [Armatimonadetes bacterium Uphvl-Ar1]